MRLDNKRMKGKKIQERGRLSIIVKALEGATRGSKRGRTNVQLHKGVFEGESHLDHQIALKKASSKRGEEASASGFPITYMDRVKPICNIKHCNKELL